MFNCWKNGCINGTSPVIHTTLLNSNARGSALGCVQLQTSSTICTEWHYDVIKWKPFTLYWPFMREITCHRWIPLTKASDAELWCFLWPMLWTNSWGASGLRSHRAYHDVTVMVTSSNDAFTKNSGTIITQMWYIDHTRAAYIFWSVLNMHIMKTCFYHVNQ